MSTGIDWNMLRGKASEASDRAHAPYSGFGVGAAGLLADGRVVIGCNVENVSYGLGVCAEVSMVCALVAAGARTVGLRAVSVAGPANAVLMPCGRCRQVLAEHAYPDLLVDHPDRPRTLGELLPEAFGPDDLARPR